MAATFALRCLRRDQRRQLMARVLCEDHVIGPLGQFHRDDHVRQRLRFVHHHARDVLQGCAGVRRAPWRPLGTTRRVARAAAPGSPRGSEPRSGRSTSPSRSSSTSSSQSSHTVTSRRSNSRACGVHTIPPPVATTPDDARAVTSASTSRSRNDDSSWLRRNAAGVTPTCAKNTSSVSRASQCQCWAISFATDVLPTPGRPTRTSRATATRFELPTTSIPDSPRTTRDSW